MILTPEHKQKIERYLTYYLKDTGLTHGDMLAVWSHFFENIDLVKDEVALDAYLTTRDEQYRQEKIDEHIQKLRELGYDI